MTPEQWREKVGRPLQARREPIFKSMRQASKAAGFTEGVWRQLESGKRQLAPGVVVSPSPAPETRAAVARVMQWEEGWLDALLAGRQPRTLHEEYREAAEALRLANEALGTALENPPLPEAEAQRLTQLVSDATAAVEGARRRAGLPRSPSLVALRGSITGVEATFAEMAAEDAINNRLDAIDAKLSRLDGLAEGMAELAQAQRELVEELRAQRDAALQRRDEDGPAAASR